jgi:dienelactone hydrolase
MKINDIFSTQFASLGRATSSSESFINLGRSLQACSQKFCKSLIGLLLITTIFGCAANLQGHDKSESKQYRIVAMYYDKNSPKSSIIVAHGCDGTREGNHYQAWASQIHSWGYNAIVVDSFLSRGFSNICNNKKIFSVMPTERGDDLIEVAEFIRTQPWHQGKIGVIGFSHGGSTALNVAWRKKTKAIDFAVAYYPFCSDVYTGIDSSTESSIPIQVHLGEKDDWTPYTFCGFPKTYTEYHLYEGATHAFDMNYPSRKYEGYWLKYDRIADTTSRKKVREFLGKMTADGAR